jgi:glycerol-3-phosphate O-acyltransferase
MGRMMTTETSTPMTPSPNPPLPPDPATEGRIFHFNRDRDDIVAEVVSRELARVGGSLDALELALNDAAFSEIARLEKAGRRSSPALNVWRELHRTLGGKPRAEKEAVFRRLATEYARDIVGNFKLSAYRFATRFVPMGLSLILRPQGTSRRFLNMNSTLTERVRVQGHVSTLQALARKGTVILVPTHSSNLDSIVIGWVIYRLGLPPFTYGAGKNLFTNPILAYFMRNLGAYRVDRRLTHGLYKDVLKTYSTVLLERGYHSLFFPGGGRCRSGAIEHKLKLGLLGTGLTAYINNLQRGKEQPNVYIVPCTINYPLVLEAATLIDDQLQQVGRSRYIIEDDEFSHATLVGRFIRQVMSMDVSVVIQIGEALDPFGNRVGPDGLSYDKRGREIDLRKYVEVHGVPQHQASRDQQYTKELGTAIADAYMRNNVILPSHLVAFTLFQVLKRRHPRLDLFKILRLDASEATVPLSEFYQQLDLLRDELLMMAEQGRIMVSGVVRKGPAEAITANALRSFGMFHAVPPLRRADAAISAGDMKLLLFYQNRLSGYGLEALFAEEVQA